MLRWNIRSVLSSFFSITLLWAPTDLFHSPAGSDDGYVIGQSASWPPSSGSSVDTVSVTSRPMRGFDFTNYRLNVGLLRFDTSAIPDTAAVTGAVLRLWVTEKVGSENPSLGGEYYDASNWPIDIGDFTSTPSNSAFGYVSFTSINLNQYNSFTLNSPSANINKGGYTGFRTHVNTSVTPPTVLHWLDYDSFEGNTTKPELEVTYLAGRRFTIIVVGE